MNNRLLTVTLIGVAAFVVTSGCIEQANHDACNAIRKHDAAEAFARGKTNGFTIGYDRGHLDGYRAAYPVGHDNGFAKGKRDGEARGYKNGVIVGYLLGSAILFGDTILPSLGIATAVLVTLLLSGFLGTLLRHPVERFFSALDEKVVAALQRYRAIERISTWEKERRNALKLALELQQLRMKQFAEEVLAAELAQSEIQKLKGEVERRLLPIHLKSITTSATRAKSLVTEISKTPLDESVRATRYRGVADHFPSQQPSKLDTLYENIANWIIQQH